MHWGMLEEAHTRLILLLLILMQQALLIIHICHIYSVVQTILLNPVNSNLLNYLVVS